MSLPGVVYLPDLEIPNDNTEQGIRQLVKILRPKWTHDNLEIKVSILLEVQLLKQVLSVCE